MIRVGIIGASGYVANELIRLLLGHKQVQIIWLGSQSYENQSYSMVYQNFFKILDLSCINPQNLESLCQEIDILFMATPHNFAAKILTPSVLERVRVIDLSADFRLKDSVVFEQWYHTSHNNKELLKEAVYGLCELYKPQIANAKLIANPGCYPTCSILSLAPLLEDSLIDPTSIIIDAKSGVSGAGRGLKLDNLFCEVNENFKAYGITSHRHTPEIEQILSQIANTEIIINFTPHLIPINRGILTTIYVNLQADMSLENLYALYEEFYQNAYFIRILPHHLSAQIRWVETSNFVDIHLDVDSRTKRVIITSAMDNLIKGAAGAAIQNMNIMYGIDEKMGLESAPIFP